MPLLLIAGAGLLTGGVLGFTIGGGTKAASNGIKYAALAGVGYLIARQAGILK